MLLLSKWIVKSALTHKEKKHPEKYDKGSGIHHISFPLKNSHAKAISGPNWTVSSISKLCTRQRQDISQIHTIRGSLNRTAL